MIYSTRRPTRCYDDTPAPAGGTPAAPAAAAAAAAVPAAPVTASQAAEHFDRVPGDASQEQVERFIARNGGPQAAVTILFREQAQHRENIRKLKEQVVPDGAVILSGDEAKHYAALKAEGLTPDKALEEVREGRKARTTLTQFERDKVARQAAAAAGFNADALAEVAKDKGLTLEVRKEKVNNVDADVAYVIPTGADGKAGAPVKLADYATASLAAYLPALTTRGAQGGTVTVFPDQGRRTDAAGGPTTTTPAAGQGGKKYLTPAERAAARK